jgi:sulfate adenylyltransferase
MSNLIAPHGGELKNLYLPEEQRAGAKEKARDLKSWDLSARQLCDIELLLCGAFSPLEGFLNKADYDSVLKDLHLADGTLWPMPITLDVSDEFAGELSTGDEIALRDHEGVLIATLAVEDIWQADKAAEA